MHTIDIRDLFLRSNLAQRTTLCASLDDQTLVILRELLIAAGQPTVLAAALPLDRQFRFTFTAADRVAWVYANTHAAREALHTSLGRGHPTMIEAMEAAEKQVAAEAAVVGENARRAYVATYRASK